MKKIIIIVLSISLSILGFYLYTKNQEAKIDEFINIDTNKKDIKQEVIAEVKAKTFTKEEIAKHNTKSDCWMYINDDVLDVTSFVSLHPGGDKILKGCGQDATNYFSRVPSHMQGTAQKLLIKLKIGNLAQ